MRTLLLLAALASSPPRAETPPIEVAEKRLASVATLFRSLGPGARCRPLTAVLELRVDPDGYVDGLAVHIPTGEPATDLRLPEVVALAAPFEGLPPGNVLASVRFACPEGRGAVPSTRPRPPPPRIGDPMDAAAASKALAAR